MEQKEINLTLGEILKLHEELNGVVDPSTNQKIKSGILDEKMLVSIKYWLNETNTDIIKEKESVDKLRNELILKYGTVSENGGTSITPYIKEDDKEIPNPKFNEFIKEYGNLLSIEKTISFYPVKIDSLNFEISGDVTIFFKILEK